MRGAMGRITIRSITTGSGSVNSEGMWVPTPVDTEVRGSFHIRNTGTSETDPGDLGKLSQRLRGVVRIPLDTVISNKDFIIIDDINSACNGTYNIENIQYTRTHLRVEIRKTDD